MPDSSRLVVPARTYVYLAEPATVAPVDATTALAAGWINVGHTTPESLDFTTSPTFDDIPSAQSDYPVRRFQTAESGTVGVELLEWSTANFQLAYGGGAVTSTGAGNFKFVPPKIGERKEKSCILEVIDGAKRYRYVFPRVFQDEGVNAGFGKGKSVGLPLRFAILGSDVSDAWYMLTNDPAFVTTPVTP